MTALEKMERLKRKTGLSETIIKQVLKAEAELVSESLAESGKAVMTGRAILEAERGVKLDGGRVISAVKIKARASESLRQRVEELLVSAELQEDDQVRALTEEVIDIQISSGEIAKQVTALK